MTNNENLNKILKTESNEIFILEEVIEFVGKDLNHLADQYQKYQDQDSVPIPRHSLHLLIVDFGHLRDKLIAISKDESKFITKELKDHPNYELLDELEQRLVNDSIKPQELVTLFSLIGKIIHGQPAFSQELIAATKSVPKELKTVTKLLNLIAPFVKLARAKGYEKQANLTK